MNADISQKTLMMLTIYSLKCGFISKAIAYGDVGSTLFADDQRFQELFAYGLLLGNRLDEMEDVLDQAEHETQNITFLKARLAMRRGEKDEDVTSRLKAYLKP